MGQEFPYKDFDCDDFLTFKNQLNKETEQLEQLFKANSLTCEQHVGGFELEAWLVDEQAQPVAENVDFLARLNNPEVVPELSLFNIELNVEPLKLQGVALRAFDDNLQQNWEHCREVAAEKSTDLMSIGVHPSLKDDQLTLKNMSKSDRYRALNEQILAMRNKQPITLNIQGRQTLHSEHSDVMLEAAATSFQIHLQVKQEQAVRAYNAAQIISAPLVAVSANSPYVFGMDLWDESRIPVFEQAVDVGDPGAKRVSFGEGFIKSSLMECFEENVKKFPVMIPARLMGGLSGFPHLRLHNGTIWRWNRPIVGFDSSGSPHVRIENRVVASGPTIKDMMANAAFYWGLVEAMIREPVAPESLIGFDDTKGNFYKACQNSLEVDLIWLDGKKHTVTDLIIDTLLPMAKKGLEFLNIDAKDINDYLGIIKNRVLKKQNGAYWQRAWIKKHGKDMQGLSMAYLKMQNTGKPVHEWEI